MLSPAMISMARAASSCWPTISRLLPLCGRKTAAVGSLMATASPSQACSNRGGSGQAGASSSGVQERVLAGHGRHVALEDDRRGRRPVPGSGAAPGCCCRYSSRSSSDSQTTWNGLLPSIQAVGVVVDRLAGPGQQPGGRVVFAEDQVGVGLAALQGDAHGHLADRAAGQRVGPAQRLRAEQHVDAERPALPHQPVQQQRRLPGRSGRPRRRTPGTRRRSAGSRGIGRPGSAVAEALEVLHAAARGTGRRGASARRRAAAARSGRTPARSRWR